MDAERFQRLDALFEAALDRPSSERRAFLERECADDPGLLAEVEAMLAADVGEEDVTTLDALGQIVHAGAVEVGQDLEDANSPHVMLGPYRIVREVGRGGLATVYLAERDDAQFSMRVAIKLVRRGLDTEDLLERLRLERQILASLEHPNIARLLDGGTAPDGQPYFVMELIEGERIDVHCDAEGLDLRQRLELFRQVCDAVHYAHQKLVLHRDLKPSNVMVTTSGTPKLLDFGIAKVLDPSQGPDAGVDKAPGAVAEGPAVDFPTLTGPGMRLLTPEFASPEQVLGEPLSTASDVYSLGVMLHLLVTGEPPYRFDRHRPRDIERVVLETDPKRPSSVVGDDQRQVLGWPMRSAGDDLDLIILQALRKEPHLRYDSAAQLADDLERYLDNRPVSACKDTYSYRVGKFVRRHRGLVASVAAVLVTLVVAVVSTTWQASVARQAQRVAEEQRNEADAQRAVAVETVDFLVDLFEVSDPYNALGETITARQVLDQGVRQIRRELDADPRLRATLLTAMGRVHLNLALFDEADTLLNEGLQLRRGVFGETSPEVGEVMTILGELRLDQERDEEGKAQLQTALAMFETSRGPDDSSLGLPLYLLARAEVALGNYGAAEALYDRALDLERRVSNPVGEARNLDAMGEMWLWRGEPEKGEQFLLEALRIRRREHGNLHPDVMHTLNDLAIAARRSGDPEAAEALYLESLEGSRELFGEHHHRTAAILGNLANLKRDQGKLGEAKQLYVEAQTTYEAIFGPSHPEVAHTLFGLSKAVIREGDYAAGRELIQRSYDMSLEGLGPEHPETVTKLEYLAHVLGSLGDPAALDRYREVLLQKRRILTSDDERLAASLVNVADFERRAGNLAAAEALLLEALEIRSSHRSPDHWSVWVVKAGLALCQILDGRPGDGLETLDSSHEALVDTLGSEHGYTLYVADLRRQALEHVDPPGDRGVR